MTMSQTGPAIPPPGVYVPSPTFFLPAGNSASLQSAVDVNTQAKHSVFLAKSGVTGLVLLGSTGEAIHLTKSERIDLVVGVRKGLEDADYPNYPIMAGVLTNGIDETLEWLHDYAKAGAQWGLVLTSGYFGKAATQENIKQLYSLVADKSQLPILM
jgi:2-keto-3-deoxy-L-rhamnonate aldolase